MGSPALLDDPTAENPLFHVGASAFTPFVLEQLQEKGIPLEGMKWRGPWNREREYFPQDCVRWKGKTYVNVVGIAHFVTPGLQAGVTLTNGVFLVNQGLLSPEELTESVLSLLDPSYKSQTEGEEEGDPLKAAVVAQAWELRATPGAEIFVPGSGFVPTEIHWEIYNDEGKKIIADNANLHYKLEPFGTGTGRFFLCANSRIDPHHPEGSLGTYKPYKILMTGAGLIATEGNKPPDVDPGRWFLIADAPPPAGVSMAEVETGFISKVLKTAQTMLGALTVPQLTVSGLLSSFEGTFTHLESTFIKVSELFGLIALEVSKRSILSGRLVLPTVTVELTESPAELITATEASEIQIKTTIERIVSALRIGETKEDGTKVTLRNVGTVNVVLEHLSAALKSNCFLFSTAANVTLHPGGAIQLVYSNLDHRWHDIGFSLKV